MDTNNHSQPHSAGDDDLFIILDRRALREVSTPVFVYDLYMPLVGAEAIGVYGAYCRLSGIQPPESAGMRYAIGSIRFMSDNCRIGKNTVTKVNQMLMDCGLINIVPPTDWQKSRHITNQVILLEPPEGPSKEAIDQYAKGDYRPMCYWLYGISTPDDPVPTWGRAGHTSSLGKDEQTKPRPYLRTGNGQIPSLGKDAMSSSLHIGEDSESQRELTYENLSDDDESEASVMESCDNDAFIRQVQVNLMTAAQQHGWFGSGFNWNKRERELALENREALTADRIAHAVDRWWEVKEATERFDPCRSFPYIIAVCKNTKDQPDEQQWPKRNGNRNGASGGYPQSGYERTVAEPKDDDIDDFPHIVWV